MQGLSIGCFVFFLLEILMDIGVHGLCDGDSAYLRRRYIHTLNLILLVIELLDLTPLSQNQTFQTISKLSITRILSLIDLRCQQSFSMSVIFNSFVYTLPVILRLFCVMVLIFIFFPLVLTKTFKNDGYYCVNAYQEVSTR